jgi:tetratricopeptide (TPR) repeat protein
MKESMFLLLLLFLQADLSQQGAQAMREGRFADAESAYRQLIKQMPNEPRLRMNLGLALHSGGKYREAIAQFEQFLKAYPQPGPAHLLMGVSRLKLRQPCEAVPPLETARKWQSTRQVLLELGDAYFGCRRYADAAKVFEAMSDTAKGLQGLGLSYARLGRTAEALEALGKLERMGDSAELHELMSEVRVIEGRNDDAVAEMETACRLAPSDSRLRRLRARAYWRAGRYDDARKDFDALAQQWSHDPEFNYERGDTMVRLEGAEAGLPLLEKAVKQDPQLTPARGALGRALVEAGKLADSIPHLEAAAPQDPTLLLPLSRAYRAAGRAQDAARAEAEYRKKAQ